MIPNSNTNQPHSPKIALVSPSFFGYEKAIKNALLNKGLDVIALDDRPKNTIAIKAVIRLRATFVAHRIMKNHQKDLIRKIVDSNANYLLLISPEVFSREMILELKEKRPSLKVILYLWDSVKNRQHFLSIIDICDVRLSFDRRDVNNIPTLSFAPLFFDPIFEVKETEDHRLYDLTFIGSYHSNRAELLKIDTSTINFFLHLFIQSRLIKCIRGLFLLVEPALFKKFITKTTYSTLPKTKVAEILKKTNTVIDLQHPDQSGLTCRTFEALASGCKLVTTNRYIQFYDFYDEEIISIVNDLSTLPFDFIKSSANPNAKKRLQKEIIKYSLDEWINRVVLENL